MKTSTSRKNRSVCSTTKLSSITGKRDTNNVLGNRHVGGCCGGKLQQLKPHPPKDDRSKSPPILKKRRKKPTPRDIESPSRRFAKANQEREEEFNNYRNLVEQRFTQMLHDEKDKL